MPLAAWLRQEPYYTRVREAFTSPAAARFFDTGALCELLEAHRAGRTQGMTQIWAVYSFLLWYGLYFGDPAPPKD